MTSWCSALHMNDLSIFSCFYVARFYHLFSFGSSDQQFKPTHDMWIIILLAKYLNRLRRKSLIKGLPAATSELTKTEVMLTSNELVGAASVTVDTAGCHPSPALKPPKWIRIPEKVVVGESNVEKKNATPTPRKKAVMVSKLVTNRVSLHIYPQILKDVNRI